MKNSVLEKEFVTMKDVGSDKACNFEECLVYLRNKPGQRVRITSVEIRKAERAGLLDPEWFANHVGEVIGVTTHSSVDRAEGNLNGN